MTVVVTKLASSNVAPNVSASQTAVNAANQAVAARDDATDAAAEATSAMNVAVAAAEAAAASAASVFGSGVTSVAGKSGAVLLSTSDIQGYEDPVAIALVFGS